MYAGQRYYVKAADVSLNDAAGASGYTGVTLRRANLYASPDASQDPVDVFWGGVVLSGYSRWDAAGEWLAIVYAGQRYYVKAADVSLDDGSGSFHGVLQRTHQCVRHAFPKRPVPSTSSGAAWRRPCLAGMRVASGARSSMGEKRFSYGRPPFR